MKKISILMSAFALAVTASAQNNYLGTEAPYAVKPATEAELNGSRAATASQQAAGERGSVFFQEDFSNGFDGDNGFGAWTFEDSGNNTIWMMATAASPAGEFSTNIDPLDSPTADNGWVIFDCDFYNTPISDGFEDVSGWLQTPAMDCSGLQSVIVEYYQYFRYCCFSLSPLTLEVSTDGGSNWTVFPAHGSFVQSANTVSANPLYTKVDISCAAAGASNVLVRWGYNTAVAAGYSHYFWGIDDVAIYENTTVNDLEVVQVTNGDIFNIWEYRVTPFEQRTLAADGGLLAGVLYRNNGNANQDNTVITVEILDEGGNVLSTTETDPFLMESFANTPECPSFLLDTLYIETGWEPTAQGNYTVRASITSDATDEDDTNNSLDRGIVYSLDEYGHENEANLDLEITPRDSEDDPGAFDPTGYGAFFTVPNSGSTAYGLTVQFGPTTDVGTEFSAILWNATGGLNDGGEVLASEDYIVTEGQLDDTYQYYPFDDAADLEPGEVYFNCVMNENTSTEQLTVAAEGNSDTDNSTAVYEIAGDGSYVWFTSQNWSPAVRLILSQRVGVDEVNDATLQLFQMFPNPAVENVVIRYTLNTSTSVAYEVRDMNGRLIEWSNLGKQQPGTQTIDLNVSNYAAGNYNVSLVVDGARMFTRALNVTK